MSDSVANVEVEDVLSSIRKLISIEARPDLMSEWRDRDGKRLKRGKLVLTVAQRVYETNTEPKATPSNMTEDDVDQKPAEGLRNENASFDVVDHDQVVELSDEQGENGPEVDPGTAPIDQQDLTSRVAAVESAVAEQQDDWELDSALEGSDTRSTIEPLQLRASERVPGSGFEANETGIQAVEEPQSDHSDDDALVLNEDMLANDALLRDMISEVVRQELQGPLGERISRNVCKLVRKEIQRALAPQSAD